MSRYVNTIPKDEAQTHQAVPQTLVVTPMEDQLSMLFALLNQHIQQQQNFKVSLFLSLYIYL